jgi:hypothetical protein
VALKRKRFKKKIKHSHVVTGLIIIVITYLGIYQNCSGEHTRSADLSISQGQVDTYIQDVECFAQTGTNQGDSANISSLASIDNQTGSLNFYAEAPSTMGDVEVVAPLQYGTLRPDGGSTPQQIYAFFTLSPSGSGSLVIAVSDSSSTSTTTSPTPAPTAATVLAQLNRPKASYNKPADTSTTSTCSSSNPLNLTTVITASSDGTTPPSYDNNMFQMTMTLGASGNSIIVTSYDVEDGSLQDTIQLELSEVDPTTGEQIYLGDVNLTQPD